MVKPGKPEESLDIYCGTIGTRQGDNSAGKVLNKNITSHHY